MNLILEYYKRKIDNFLKEVVEYCEDNNIDNFYDFLFYNKNDICSPAYYILQICPSVFLVNSKSFKKYYNTLDKDFQNDLIPNDKWNEYIRVLKRNKNLLNYIKEIQGDDSVL